MKVIMYMAISANGMIARKDDNTSWISKEEWDSYSFAVRNAGCLIVGRRTYEILTKQPEFSEFKDVALIAVSKNKIKLVSEKHKIAASPEEALKLLRGSKEVIVAGGGILNSAFLEKNLVDELYLDVEPIIISDGIPVFKGGSFEKALKLLGQKKISNDEIQFHFKIVK
jgi:dihydrofolate reductase